MKGTSESTKRSDAAAVIAELYGYTPRYIRRVVADTKKKTYKGEKPDKIRELYTQYISGKTKLIKQLEQLIKVA